jgi:dTDP-4-amino-4,6-dideoxygalactose transaminase
MTQVPLLDLQAQMQGIRSEIEAAIAEVLSTQRFIGGPRVDECEQAIAAYSNCAYGIGVSSGTDALLVCLMAENIGAGDEVITTPYTFFATAGSICRTGARPVFVDIDPRTYNMDVSQIADRVTKKTRAIMPVHLFGQMADMTSIMSIADRHGLCVIEDAAQAIGAEWDGRRAGSIGHYGCFSFFPSKNLGCLGDGGMVVTNDKVRAERVKRMRNHGAEPKYFHQLIGGNFRLDALQAAVVTVKLKYLDDWTQRRQENAAAYDRLLSSVDVVRPVVLPNVRHVFNQYVIRTSQRDALRKHLTERQIGTEIYYPLSLHEQECFAHLGYDRKAYPRAIEAAAQTLALPIYPELTPAQRAHVASSIRDFF